MIFERMVRGRGRCAAVSERGNSLGKKKGCLPTSFGAGAEEKGAEEAWRNT